MHESALAKRILDEVLQRAGAARAQRVRSIHGWIADTESLSAQSLAFHFRAHALGTLAEGAELDLRLIHVEARCGACGTEYAPEHHLLLCPSCGSSDGEELGQSGLGIERLEVE